MSRRPSLNDFKTWLAEQKNLSEFFNISPDPVDDLVGRDVKAKVSLAKILQRMIVTEGDKSILAQELVSEGGTLMGTQEDNVFIEVRSGSFQLPGFCVRIKDK